MALFSRGVFHLRTAVRSHLPATTLTAGRRFVSTHTEIQDLPSNLTTRRPITTQGEIHDQPREPVPTKKTDSQFKINHSTTKDALTEMIHKLPMNRTIVTHPLMSNWLNHHENYCPYFWATTKDGELAGFALLHKTEAFHTKKEDRKEGVIPHALDLVYVLPQFRSEGLAHILLQEAIKHYEIHCFCPDKETAELLSICGFQQTNVKVDKNPDYIHMTYP